jgi:hypothetical protein
MGKKIKNDFKFSIIRSVSWIPIGFFILSQLNSIIDPEYPILIFDLEILKLESIIIKNKIFSQLVSYEISFFPTYGQCKLAPLLGISIIMSILKKSTLKKAFKQINKKWSLNFKIILTNENHSTGENITKQLNDRERLSAALENSSIRLSVLKCMKSIKKTKIIW